MHLHLEVLTRVRLKRDLRIGVSEVLSMFGEDALRKLKVVVIVATFTW
jgi:hypothetical protein